MMLTADSPEVVEFAAAYQENRNLAQKWPMVAVVTQRRLYILVDDANDDGTGQPVPYTRSGRFMVERSTGAVFTIQGYGKRGHRIGTLEKLTASYRAGSATFNPAANAHRENAYSKAATWPQTRQAPTLTMIQGGRA